MELTTINLGDLVKLGQVIFAEAYDSVKQSMIDSGMVKKMSIPAHSGNTREFSEIDSNEYLAFKGEGDQAGRGKVVQGLTNLTALIKSLLIDFKTLVLEDKNGASNIKCAA